MSKCNCQECRRLLRRKHPSMQRKKRPLHDIFVKAPRENKEE